MAESGGSFLLTESFHIIVGYGYGWPGCYSYPRLTSSYEVRMLSTQDQCPQNAIASATSSLILTCYICIEHQLALASSFHPVPTLQSSFNARWPCMDERSCVPLSSSAWHYWERPLLIPHSTQLWPFVCHRCSTFAISNVLPGKHG